MSKIINAHRRLWLGMNGMGNVFKIIDRKLINRYKDKLTAPNSPHSRMLVSIRNAIYFNRSVVIEPEALDLVFDFAYVHVAMTVCYLLFCAFGDRLNDEICFFGQDR